MLSAVALHKMLSMAPSERLSEVLLWEQPRLASLPEEAAPFPLDKARPVSPVQKVDLSLGLSDDCGGEGNG